MMTITQTVAQIVDAHVTLEVECIDRMYLNLYVPGLQYVNGVVEFCRSHRKQPIASTALIAPISKKFVAAIESYVQENKIPVVLFQKGQRKDEIAKQYLAGFKGLEGIVFVGKAQEKPRCSGPRSGEIRQPVRAIHGSCARRRWSITITFTGSMPISVRSF